MKLKDFNFHLPRERIARYPVSRRDRSKLMVVDRQTGSVSHGIFKDIAHLIDKNDFMVVNDSRVIPAKLFGKAGGHPVEILLIKDLGEKCAETLTLPAKRFKRGACIFFGGGLQAEVVDVGMRGRRILKFNQNFELVSKQGYAPLPPYIKRKSTEAGEYKKFDISRYQTVYAKNPGSITAPTAGLHFTPSLLEEIKKKIRVMEINLEVGEATFQKLEVENIEEHKMGKETITIAPEVWKSIEHLKKNRKLIAVGTTTVRALETYVRQKSKLEKLQSELFIYPGFRFLMIDKLITNFHLPESSLFILVAAFAGLELMQKAYQVAIEKNYRFFSYGDAMYIV